MDSFPHSNRSFADEGAVPSPFNMNLEQLRDTAQDADVLPASQQQEDSDAAQLGGLKGNLSLLPGSLRSQATYKTRELAAAAGAVRHGPAGANLRLAGTICRSSSGSLVDALLSEAARVEGGMLTAGLPRSDSLPDMVCGELSGVVDPVQAALDAALAQGGMNSVRDCLREIAAMDSTLLKGLDSALPFTISGLGSLQLFMEAPSELLALGADDAAPRAPTQQQDGQQQQQQAQQQHWQQQGGLGGAAGGFGGGGGGTGWLNGQFGATAGMGQQQQQVMMPGMQAGGAVDNREVVRYSRVISCKTYLKRLNITQPMAEHLLPHHDLHAPPQRHGSGGCNAADDDAGDSPRGGGGSRPGGSSYELLFKEEVSIVDREGGRFRVQYEGVSCNAQKHLRLTSGWRDYIRAHNVEVGDTVVFERRGEERRVLHVSLVKGDGPPAADGPPAKRKRVSRAQAVQRLE
ncbi:hypothetical protein OEZ86_000147 [Tetradesmus obliquus]|nr:hypothetical protein OEZ86_000147 [Tetradesmus obliquus]